MISLQEAYQRLLERYGTHSEAARQLGISPRRYREYRAGNSIPVSKAKLIRLMATKHGAQLSN